MNKNSQLSIVILTYNEEVNLPICLASLSDLNAIVYIVDSGSTDRTIEIAKEYGCSVNEHEFFNYATQLNWALDNLPIATKWVMRLDADERLTSELKDEITKNLPVLDKEVTGIMIKRRVYFWGRWIRFGGYYPTWLLRIWRKGHARCEQRWMDEHMVVDSGLVKQFCYDFIDENNKGLSFWTDKHNGYADREVMDLMAVSKVGDDPSSLGGQAQSRRWFKKNIYAHIPLFLRSFLYWFYRYFIRLGILDGVPGLVFHFLQGFWYRFLVDAKLYELKRSKLRNSE